MRTTSRHWWLSSLLAWGLLAPTSATATATLTLSWDAAPDPPATVTRWRVYKAPAPAGPWTLLKSVTTQSTRMEVPVGATGCFRVRAVDEFGQASPDSARLCVAIEAEVLP